MRDMAIDWDVLLEGIQQRKADSLAKLKSLLERIHRQARIIPASEREGLKSMQARVLNNLRELAKKKRLELEK